MKLIISLLTILIINKATEINLQEKWLEFKTTYNKTYFSPEEEMSRFEIFKINLQEIDEHNLRYSKNIRSYKKAINKFADMNKSEFAAHVYIDGGLASPPRRGNKGQLFLPSKNKTQTLPFEIDWRKRGVVSNVKNQGNCGSCWSFSATGAIESQLALKEGRLVLISEQNLVDCSHTHHNVGCSGGWPHWAFDYVIDEGVPIEKEYPYTGTEGECRNGSVPVVNIAGYYVVPWKSEAWLQYFVGTMGPVSICFHATAELQFYEAGIFKSYRCSSSLTNHCVLVVGYGVDEQGRDYWIVKNSWGPEWGQKGYFYLARNANNMCAIAAGAAVPFL